MVTTQWHLHLSEGPKIAFRGHATNGHMYASAQMDSETFTVVSDSPEQLRDFAARLTSEVEKVIDAHTAAMAVAS